MTAAAGTNMGKQDTEGTATVNTQTESLPNNAGWGISLHNRASQDR